MDEDFFEEEDDVMPEPPIDESLNRSIPSLPQIGGTPYRLGGVPVTQGGGIVTKRKDSYMPGGHNKVGEEVSGIYIRSLFSFKFLIHDEWCVCL